MESRNQASSKERCVSVELNWRRTRGSERKVEANEMRKGK